MTKVDNLTTSACQVRYTWPLENEFATSAYQELGHISFFTNAVRWQHLYATCPFACRCRVSFHVSETRLRHVSFSVSMAREPIVSWSKDVVPRLQGLTSKYTCVATRLNHRMTHQRWRDDATVAFNWCVMCYLATVDSVLYIYLITVKRRSF